MMNRPVVKAELVEWMRSSQTQITGELAEVMKQLQLKSVVIKKFNMNGLEFHIFIIISMFFNTQQVLLRQLS